MWTVSETQLSRITQPASRRAVMALGRQQRRQIRTLFGAPAALRISQVPIVVASVYGLPSGSVHQICNEERHDLSFARGGSDLRWGSGQAGFPQHWHCVSFGRGYHGQSESAAHAFYEIDVDTWHHEGSHSPTAAGDSTAWMSQFAGSLECSLESSLSGCVKRLGRQIPPSCHGRARRTQPTVQVEVPVSMKPSRPGEETLRHDLLSRETIRWFAQLRRLQSLCHSLKAGREHVAAQVYSASLWNSIVRSKGFRSGFQACGLLVQFSCKAAPVPSPMDYRLGLARVPSSWTSGKTSASWSRGVFRRGYRSLSTNTRPPLISFTRTFPPHPRHKLILFRFSAHTPFWI